MLGDGSVAVLAEALYHLKQLEDLNVSCALATLAKTARRGGRTHARAHSCTCMRSRY